VSPIAVRQQAADQAQVAIPQRVAQAAIHRVVHRANHQSASLVQTLPVAILRSRHQAVPTANPAIRLIQVPTIRSHPNRTACPVYRAATPHPANPIPVIPNRATPSRAIRNQVTRNLHRVNRPATVGRRRIQAIPADLAQAIAIRAAVIQVIAIPKVPAVNHKAIPKASLIPTAAPSAPASLNLRVTAQANRKANPNRRAVLIANPIREAIPTVQADQVTLAVARRARAILEAQVLLKAPPKALANRPAIADRKAKAKIQVANDHRIAPAIIQAIATQQVIIHQAVHPAALRIAIPKAIRIHSHRILTHLTVVAQAHRIRSHQANHRREAQAAVATARGFGHAVGSCLIPTVKAQNHPKVLVAMTER
jgi:hypothetical protein